LGTAFVWLESSPCYCSGYRNEVSLFSTIGTPRVLRILLYMQLVIYGLVDIKNDIDMSKGSRRFLYTKFFKACKLKEGLNVLRHSL